MSIESKAKFDMWKNGIISEYFYYIKYFAAYFIVILTVLRVIYSMMLSQSLYEFDPQIAILCYFTVLFTSGSFIDSQIPRYRTVYCLILLESLNIMCFLERIFSEEIDRNACVLVSMLVSIFMGCGILRYRWLVLILQIKTVYIWMFLETKLIPYSFTNLLVFLWISFILILWSLKKELLIHQYFTSKQKISRNQENFRNVLGDMGIGLVVLSSEMKIKLKNETFVRHFEITDDEEIVKYLNLAQYSQGRRFYSSTPSSDCLMLDVIHYFNSETQPITFGVTKHFDHFYEWKGSISTWNDKKCLILLSREITSLIEIEKSRTEQLYMTAILRSFSHELRTPTSAIISANEYMLESVDKTDLKGMQNLLIVKASSRLLLSLINDLIDFVLITREKFQLTRSSFPMHQLLNETFELFSLQSDQKSISFNLCIDSAIPCHIFSDPDCIKQVLINLLSNALKFTFKGSILLKASLKQNFIKFSVKDTGIGISSDRLDKLFNLFETAENQGSQTHGCGLGLHISSMLVKKLGNDKLFVKSQLGVGTKFSFLVDIQESLICNDCDSLGSTDEEVHPIYLPASVLSFSKNKGTPAILIVDDNDFNRLILKEMLTREGMRFNEAINGKQAVELIKQENKYQEGYKVVIMDCQMPIMDGWEASIEISRMKQHGEIKHKPAIIAYTAYSGSEEEAKSRSSGMVDFLRKPAPKEEILRVLNRYLC